MPHTHGPMNTVRVNQYLAQVTAREFCPGYRRWWMFQWTDWGLERLEILLAEKNLKPDSHNSVKVALPIMKAARFMAKAYLPDEAIQSPMTPNFRDVVDCVLTLPLDQTQLLMRRLRRLSHLVADHCERHQIAARAWETGTDHARVSNPCFCMRLLVQGAAMFVRDGHGRNLIQDLVERNVSPFKLVRRALGPGIGNESFVKAIAEGTTGHFGNGKVVYSTSPAALYHRRRRRATVRG